MRGVRDFSGANTYEIVERLEREKPPCAICRKPCVPSKETVEIILVPIPDRERFDLNGMLVVHADRCAPEARDRIERAKADNDGDLDRGVAELGLTGR